MNTLRKIANSIVLLTVLVSVCTAVQPVYAQSISPIAQLLDGLKGANIPIKFLQHKDLLDNPVCTASFHLPVPIENLYHVRSLAEVGVILNLPIYQSGKFDYSIDVDLTYCLPPGKSASEGESTDPPGQPAGHPAQIDIPLPAPTPGSSNVIAFGAGGLVLILILLVVFVH